MAVQIVTLAPYEATGAGTSLQLDFTTVASVSNGCILVGFGTSTAAGATIKLDGAGSNFTSIVSNGGANRGYAILIGDGLSIGAHTIDISWTGTAIGQAGGWVFSGVDQTLTSTQGVVATDGGLILANPATLAVTSVAGDLHVSTARTTTSTLAPNAPSVAAWGGLQSTTRLQGAADPTSGSVTYSWSNGAVSCRVNVFNVVQTAFSAATSLPAMNMLSGSGGVVGREYM